METETPSTYCAGGYPVCSASTGSGFCSSSLVRGFLVELGIETGRE